MDKTLATRVDITKRRYVRKKEIPVVVHISESWMLLLKPSTWHCNRLPTDNLPAHLSRIPLDLIPPPLAAEKKRKLEKRLKEHIECETVQGMHEFAKSLYAYYLVSGKTIPKFIPEASRKSAWITPELSSNLTEFPDIQELLEMHGQKDEKRGKHICAMVHRLDLETSGVLLFATSANAQAVLRTAFRSRMMSKSYLVLVHGTPPDTGSINKPLITLSNAQSRKGYRGDGKTHGCHFTRCAEPEEEGCVEAHTTWVMLRVYRARKWESALRQIGFTSSQIAHHAAESISHGHVEGNDSKTFSLLRVKIVTGRTHQIRVHLGHLGFPVVGDGKYLPPAQAYRDRLWCPRQWLHSSELVFVDPSRVSSALMEFIESEALRTKGTNSPQRTSSPISIKDSDTSVSDSATHDNTSPVHDVPTALNNTVNNLCDETLCESPAPYCSDSDQDEVVDPQAIQVPPTFSVDCSTNTSFDKSITQAPAMQIREGVRLPRLIAKVPLCDDIATALTKGCVLIREVRLVGKDLPSAYSKSSISSSSKWGKKI